MAIIGLPKIETKLTLFATSMRDASELMRDIGGYLEKSVKRRTHKGRDAEGSNFDPYSKSWAKVRQSVGLPIDHVDLFFGGSMMNAMTYKTTKNSMKLFFMNTDHVDHTRIPGRKKSTKKRKQSNEDIAMYNEILRPFFTLSKKETKTIVKMSGKFFRQKLK